MKQIAICLLIILSLNLSGCAAAGEVTSASTEVFVDSTGRSVCVPAEITKIAITGPLSQVYILPLAGDMLVGVSNEGNVTGLQVRSMEETYGLGAEALTDWQFLAQFLRTEGDAEVGSNIDAITGATVTSKAIARSVNSAVGFVTGADTSSGATSWGG